MSETDEGAVKLLKACDDMLDLHRRQGTDACAAARQVAAKRREVEQRLRLAGDVGERELAASPDSTVD